MIRVPWSEGSVDGSEILRSSVEGKVAEIPLFTRFYTSQVVSRISEPINSINIHEVQYTAFYNFYNRNAAFAQTSLEMTWF